MASLNHVCIWSEKGWKRITAEEASSSHPDRGGVSYRSGLFRCDLCGQYVGLTKKGKYVSHFRHSDDELSKDCPDKTDGSVTRYSFVPGVHTLPLRLSNIKSTSFELEIGFLPVPEYLYPEVCRSRITICAQAQRETPLVYNGTRILEEGLTYLSVGNRISERYYVTCSNASEKLREIWPRQIDGVKRLGTLFDGKTGKKLPPDADVQANHDYFLLSASEPRWGKSIRWYRISEARLGIERWRIYKVTATSFCEDAARFFMDYHCRLTESPVLLFPLWPVSVDKPYVILHKQALIWMFLQGYSVKPKVFPSSHLVPHPAQNEDQQLIQLYSTERQQLLSTGRTKVLRYTYLWRDELNHTASTPVIKAYDVNGTAIDGEIQNNLPKERILVIRSQFDGMVEVRDHEKLIRRYRLKANEQTDVEVQFGYAVAAFQGLDCVLNLRFERQSKEKKYDEKTVLKKLRRCSGTQIPISHEWGSLALKYRDYPMVKRWMRERIRVGSIPKSALQVLKQYQRAIEREERES